MSRMDGMNYAPQGKPSPVCRPGDFTFAAAHLDHDTFMGNATAFGGWRRTKMVLRPRSVSGGSLCARFQAPGRPPALARSSMTTRSISWRGPLFPASRAVWDVMSWRPERTILPTRLHLRSLISANEPGRWWRSPEGNTWSTTASVSIRSAPSSPGNLSSKGQSDGFIRPSGSDLIG